MCEMPLGSLFEDVIYAFASIVRPATTADHNVATEERLHVTNEVLFQLSRQLAQNCRSYSGQRDVERRLVRRLRQTTCVESRVDELPYIGVCSWSNLNDSIENVSNSRTQQHLPYKKSTAVSVNLHSVGENCLNSNHSKYVSY